MEIQVRDIPAGGIAIAVNENADQFDPNIIEGELAGSFTLSRSGDSVRIGGILRASLQLLCGRCLEEFPRSLHIPVRVAFEKEAGDDGLIEGDPETNDYDVSFYQGESINLTDLAREELLLNLPMSFLCTDGCLGLCPRCGNNQNRLRCACDLDDGDPRWAPLKKFLKR